ncbi:MAG: radical SAM family heme chaperone HemW [Bacteroidales bacterium]|nr:radical SAM family heme chaperone HemW [Bacteroidales bacterium]
MAGIYIHIPFCRKKCHYCNFYTVISQKYKQSFLLALKKEIELRTSYLNDQWVNTIYFGGGTPTILDPTEINELINTIKSHYQVIEEVEITLEANPDDLSPDYLKRLKDETPVNRFSIGIQSFFDDDLEYLNRAHGSSQARNAIENALNLGYNNMTIDLIYGIPTLTDEKWKKNLQIFFDYKLPHLSSYALTVEPGTNLDVLINKKKTASTEEDQTVQHFEILLEETEKHGYIHYEISNFAKEGYYSKHNSIYWLGGHYLGLGPSAHSFNGITRQWNVKNMKAYCEAPTVDHLVLEKEILSVDQQYNEYIMTSLRTSWGCDTEHILNVFGSKFKTGFELDIQPFVQQNKAIRQGNTYRLTKLGKLFADGIAGTLFRGF